MSKKIKFSKDLDDLIECEYNIIKNIESIKNSNKETTDHHKESLIKAYEFALMIAQTRIDQMIEDAE